MLMTKYMRTLNRYQILKILMIIKFENTKHMVEPIGESIAHYGIEILISRVNGVSRIPV